MKVLKDFRGYKMKGKEVIMKKRSPEGNEYIKPNHEKMKENYNERFKVNSGLEKAKKKCY